MSRRFKWASRDNVAEIGAGVFEYRLDFDPGYRKRQQKDIEAAKSLWKQYKQRERQES